MKKIIVEKSNRTLIVLENDIVINKIKIALGKNPIGKKQFQGDSKTPEGKYTINNKSTYSKFYKNLSISYPNNEDSSFAASHNKSAGGEIKIHGIKNGLGFLGIFHRLLNWTDGCIAVRNKNMDYLFDNIPVGTEIIIKP